MLEKQVRVRIKPVLTQSLKKRSRQPRAGLAVSQSSSVLGDPLQDRLPAFGTVDERSRTCSDFSSLEEVCSSSRFSSNNIHLLNKTLRGITAAFTGSSANIPSPQEVGCTVANNTYLLTFVALFASLDLKIAEGAGRLGEN